MNCFEIITFIVGENQGSKVLQKAKKCGVNGGTVIKAVGTVSDHLCQFLSLYDERKEVVIMACNTQVAKLTMNTLSQAFKFHKPNHGIAFSVLACQLIGFENCHTVESEEEKSMYHAIYTIVNRGNAEDVIEAAKAGGSKGGTILNARGSGISETMRLFQLEVEPEKEVVLILSKKDTSNKIIENIRSALKIDEPGNGIIFVQDVVRVEGIYE